MKTGKSRLLGAVLLAAGLVAGVQAAEPVKGLKMWQMNSGVLELDKGWLTAMSGVGTKITIPVTMVVIHHPRHGVVLFDTGNNVAVSDGKCAEYWGSGLCSAFNAKQTRDEVIDRQLEKLGFRSEDVKYVIYSHFHLDHAGNIKLFPKAKHVVQKDELKTAWWPEKFQRAAYVLKDYDTTRDFDFMQLSGDFDLFGDGSILVLDSKGHTQGHQSILVNLPKSGPIIVAGDAIYTAENERGTIPGITWNTNESMRSIDRLKQIRDARGGTIWYSHDAEQYKANKRGAYE